jgi:hypothetical protein
MWPSPTCWKGGAYETIPYRNIDNIAPAGAINSSVEEMSRWLRLHLNGGVFQGQRLLAEGSLEEMHTPWMVLPTEGGWPPTTRWTTSSSTAWVVPPGFPGPQGCAARRGDRRDDHLPGHGPGPEAGCGGGYQRGRSSRVRCRVGPPGRPSGLARPGDSRRPSSGRGGSRWPGPRNGGWTVEAGRAQGTRPIPGAGRLWGEYRDPMYGTFRVEESGGRLPLLGGFHGDLEHWHYDTFRLTWEDPTTGPPSPCSA